MNNKAIRATVEAHNLRVEEERRAGRIFGFIPYTTADGAHGEIKEELTGMTKRELLFWLGY